MTCPNCGAFVPDGDYYCEKCGEPIPLTQPEEERKI
ncbi:MAG: zinc-ribbon domain-containing protein [Vampirovibrionales bacterium]|nr:zinc-ribbon domain-containing protein [Vampirovibrionales bacterium]